MAVVPGQDALGLIKARPVTPVYQDPNAANGAFGQDSAQALQKTGAVLERASGEVATEAMRMAREDAVRQAKSLDNEFARRVREVGYGDGTNNNPGFYAAQGDDAVSAAPTAKEQIKKIRDDMLNGVSTPLVKSLFGSAADARLTQEYGTIDRHTLVQRQAANDLVSASRIKEAVDDASAAWNDPEVLKRSLAVVTDEVNSSAQRHGWGDDVKASKYGEEASKVYMGAIESAAQVDATTAQNLLNTYRDQIDGRFLPKLERDLKTTLNAERIASEHADTMARRQREDTANKAESDYYSQLVTGNVDPRTVAQDSRFDLYPDKKHAILAAIKVSDKGDPPAVVSRGTLSDLMERIHLPDDDPRKIRDETDINQQFIDGKLTREDLKFARAEFQDARTPEGTRLGQVKTNFLKGIKTQITKSTPLSVDPRGDGNFYNYQRYVEDQIARARSKGENVYDLFDQKSDKWLGDPGKLAPFQSTLQDSLKYLRDSLQRGTQTASPTTITPAAPVEYKSLADLQAAQKAGKIKRDAAIQYAREKGWVQ